MKSSIHSMNVVFSMVLRFVLAMIFNQCVCSATVVGAEIRVQIDNDSPQVAEAFWLTVKVAADENASVVFPELPLEMGPFEVLSQRDWFDVPEGKHRTWTRNFELESLQGGDLEIPPVQVSVDGDVLSSEPILIAIPSVVEAEADPYSFRDIKPPIDIPEEPIQKSKWMVWAVAGSALLTSALGVTAWFFYRKRGLLPAEWALQELELIRNSAEFQQSHAPSVSARIADIMRQYIERRFDIHATRQTTDEFLEIAQHDVRLDAAQQTLLKKFLQHADEIKFAQFDPEVGQLEDSYRLVQNFVRSSAGDAK